MIPSFIIFAPFYKDFTKNGGSMIRIAGYTEGIESNGVDYKFYSFVKPKYVPDSKYIKSSINSRWQKIFVIYNILYSQVYLRPFLIPIKLTLLKFSGIKEVIPFLKERMIWTHQEYTLALFLFFVYKTPFIYDIHGFFDIQQEYRKDLNIWKKFWFDIYTIQEKIVLKQAPYLNVVSSKMRDYVINRFITQSKIFIAPDGIPDELEVYNRTKANESFKVDNNICSQKVILYAGSFKKLGGVSELVRVFVENPEIYQKSVLVLVGEGQEENNINKMTETRNLKNQIFHIRSIPHEELISLMKMADVIVCPDLDNNIYNQITPHIKLYDAIASGKNVVATDFDVNKELFPENMYPIFYFSHCVNNDFKNTLLKSLEIKQVQEIDLSNLENYTYKARAHKYLNNYEN